MQILHLYSPDFPDEHKVQNVDVVTLYHEGRFDNLDAVIVCKDKNGKVTATFGQNNWNCLPFSRKKNSNNLSIKEFDEMPELQRELKLLIWGWLFNKNPKQRKTARFSAIRARLGNIKIAYRFLMEHHFTSLQALSKQKVWEEFKEHLADKEYSKSVLEKCFVAINKAIELAPWHRISLGFNGPIKPKLTAQSLNDAEGQQILVIPERLCDEIYSKAIGLIEDAHPFRRLILDIENALQANYLQGKCTLDAKINNGQAFIFMGGDGSINHRKYRLAINDNLPLKARNIIQPLAKKLPHIPLKNASDFRRYLGQLITSCYIVCAGFSGMRDSEVDKLTPDSYYKDTFEGRDYHMLQSHTFKLGEKRETWVTAVSSKIAIDLMSVLTKRWRGETTYPDEKYSDSLWVNQGARSIPPRLITNWNLRLQRYFRQFEFIVAQKDYQECIESNPCSHEKIKQSVIIGQPWPISTHQFRRTLAFYCIKNRLSTLVALKQQFKHLYLSMTQWYTNGGKLASLRDLKVDETIQQALEEISAETTTNKIFKQWHSDEILSGAHGKAIMKMRGEMPTIYSSWNVIYKAVKEGKLTLHGSLHSYCKNGYDCDMDGVVTPQFCVDCSSGSSIIDEQQAKWWQKKHRSLSAYMALGEDISVTDRTHYITQIRAAENVMQDFSMEFTAFEAGLAVKEI